jgi:hypothetical protein
LPERSEAPAPIMLYSVPQVRRIGVETPSAFCNERSINWEQNTSSAGACFHTRKKPVI